MQNEPDFQPSRALLPPCTLVEEEPEAGCETGSEALPDVPILLSTRLQLELLLQEPVLDLRAVSAVILEDLGATLQILRLVGEEYGMAAERPVRIEDCIASLDTEVWFEAVAATTLVQNSRAAGAWQHAKKIGRVAEQLAEQEDGLRPGEAQLVGLLHEIGKLPELLGWPRTALAHEDRALVAAVLVERWNLPQCVLAATREQPSEASPTASPWSTILKAAHAWVQREEARVRQGCEASASCA